MMPLDTTREKRSKWGLFSHKGDKDPNNNGNHDAAITDGAAPDSTYGGSETSATSGHSLDDNHNNRNNRNNNRNNNNNNNNNNINHRNHTLNNDNDNSQTVTTTTTTTTTTTSGPGSNTSSSHNADPSQRGNNGYNYENTDRPGIPTKSTRRDHSPSAMGTNYSRPSNSSPLSPDAHPNALSSNPANSQYGPHSTTLQGLKTAAAGIHGAGETLRGTVNSAVDRRFNEQPATVAAHQQIAEQGRREIETGRLNHSGSTATQNSYHPNVDGGTGMPRKGILRKKVDDKEGSLRPVGF